MDPVRIELTSSGLQVQIAYPWNMRALSQNLLFQTYYLKSGWQGSNLPPSASEADVAPRDYTPVLSHKTYCFKTYCFKLTVKPLTKLTASNLQSKLTAQT